jgi:hypothetical protein
LIRRRYGAEPGPEPNDLRPEGDDLVELDFDRVAGREAEASACHAMNARP